MVIKRSDQTQEVLSKLIALSIQWEQENSCYGYRRNSAQDIERETIFLAEEEGDIVGYLLCHRYIQEQNSCTVPKESQCLEIEELYVIPTLRSQGVGSKLFHEAVAYYGDDISYVTLSTATKNYQAILHFYIDELGMTFWNARLFKEMQH